MRQDGGMRRLPRPARRTVVVILVAAWLAAITLPPAVLLQMRSSWLEALDRPAVQTDWDTFRRDMRSQSGRDAPVTGPVQRKVPRSMEPPLKVWLRDHVGLAITAWVLFGTVLCGFSAVMVIGLLAENESRGSRDAQKDEKRDAEDAQQ